jgi:YD repeat-containing protein
MRKLRLPAAFYVLLYFFLFLQVNVYAGDNTVILKREVWEWSNGTKHIIFYDNNGDVEKRVVEEKGEEIYSSSFYYDYDEEGRKNKGYSEDTDGDSAVYTYKYNHQGQLIEENWEWKNNDSGSFKAHYEYNENGDVSSCNVEDIQSGGAVYGYTITYEYDEQGKKIKADLIDSYNETAVISYEYAEGI